MKKLTRLLITSLLGMCVLTSCDTIDYTKENYTWFVIDYETPIGYPNVYERLLIRDFINLTKEEVYDLYFKEKLSYREGAYTFDGFTYSNGDEYVFDAEETKNYINQSVKNRTADMMQDFPLDYRWNLIPTFTVNEFTVQYVGYEDDSSFDKYRSFSYEHVFSVPEPKKDYYTFKGWKDVETGSILLGSIAAFGYKNLVLEPIFEADTFKINYTLPFEIDNPNPTSFTYEDEPFDLIRFDNHPGGGYTFIGFFEGEQEITRIDTKNPQKHDIEARFVIPEYTAKYFVDGVLKETKIFDYLTIKDYVEPAVPDKEHYHNARWSQKVTEFKNYVINAEYDIDTFTISISNNAGVEIQNKTVDYGTSLEALYEELGAMQLQNKSFVGLFSDEAHTKKVSASTVVSSNLTLYAYWEDIVHLKTYDDLLTINKDFQGTYIMDNDISCVGQSLPTLASFKGVFDGNGHSIKRFSNTNTSTGNNYAVFGTNYGVIKNVTFEDGTFVAKNTANENQTYLGMISSINEGTISNVDVKSCTTNFGCNYYIYINNSVDVSANLYAGIYCAYNNGTIANCLTDVNTEASFDSSLAYTRDIGADRTINCYANYGTFAGVNNSKIINVEAHNTVKSNKLAINEATHDWIDTYFAYMGYYMRLGGVCGYNNPNSTVDKSVSKAYVETSYTTTSSHTKGHTSYAFAGGITGINDGTISMCHTTEDALIYNYSNAQLRLGGIAGSANSTSKVRSCYSECRFKTGIRLSSAESCVGGIVGANAGQITYSHASVTSIEQETTTKRAGGVGSISGVATETSSATYCLGYINLTDELLLTTGYNYAKRNSGSIVANVAVFSPDQATEITLNEDVAALDSYDALIAQASKYYFDEAGFEIHNDKLPTINGLGKIAN